MILGRTWNMDGRERRIMKRTILMNCLAVLPWLCAVPCLANVQVIPGEAVPMGDLRSDETRAVQYQVVNHGNSPITIRKVRSGCSCTVAADYSAAPIPPGGAVMVTLRISGDKLDEGPFERVSILEFNEAAPVTLRFAGRSVHAVSVQPSRNVSLPPITGPDQAWCQVLTITGNLPGGKRLVLGTPVAGPKLELTLAEEAPSRYRLTIRPKLPQPLGALREEIKLPVTEPAGTPPAVVLLKGQVGPRLLALPPVLDVPAGSGAATCRLILKYAGAGKKLAAADLTLQLPPGVTRQSMTDLPEGGALLVLSFDSSLRTAGKQGQVEIAAAASAPVRVPYYIINPDVPKPTAVPEPK
jgi:hypothetical protein